MIRASRVQTSFIENVTTILHPGINLMPECMNSTRLDVKLAMYGQPSRFSQRRTVRTSRPEIPGNLLPTTRPSELNPRRG